MQCGFLVLKQIYYFYFESTTSDVSNIMFEKYQRGSHCNKTYIIKHMLYTIRNGITQDDIYN